MTQQTKNSGSAPGLSIQSETVRQVVQFSIRLVAAYAVIIALIQLMTPLIELLIARGARNLLGLVSSQYYLKTIEFIDGGYAFTTWIGPLRGGFKLPTLLFTFGFPIGYAMALPGFSTLRYWLRTLVVVLISYFVCAISVAIVCETRLTATFMQFGIVLQPEWRRELAIFAQYYLWMFTVRLYPLVTVVILTLVSGQFRHRGAGLPGSSRHVLGWSVAVTLCLLLVASVGFDHVAEARIQRVARESIFRRLDGLEKLNPEIGPGLVKLAEYSLRQRNDRAAVNAYRLAVEHLAGAALREARTQRNLVHERIKAAMLEELPFRGEGGKQHVTAP